MTTRPSLLLIVSLTAAACGAAGGASGKVAARSGGAIVPWLDRPVPRYTIPPQKRLRHATTAPPCRAAQIRAAELRSGVGLGNVLERFGFTNVASSPCLLRGFPRVAGIADGTLRPVPVRRSPAGTYFGALSPADMPPGGRILVDLATTDVCGGSRSRTFTDLRFRLPSGGWVRTGAVLHAVCHLPMTLSPFGLPERWTSPPRRPGTPDVLRIRLALPSSVRVGTMLRFTVSLSNPTGSAVRLSPCPGYTEGLFAGRHRIENSYRLNCTAVHAIPARGRVRYAMRLLLPGTLPAGVAKIWWYLHTPADLPAGGALIIVE